MGCSSSSSVSSETTRVRLWINGPILPTVSTSCRWCSESDSSRRTNWKRTVAQTSARCLQVLDGKRLIRISAEVTRYKSHSRRANKGSVVRGSSFRYSLLRSTTIWTSSSVGSWSSDQQYEVGAEGTTSSPPPALTRKGSAMTERVPKVRASMTKERTRLRSNFLPLRPLGAAQLHILQNSTLLSNESVPMSTSKLPAVTPRQRRTAPYPSRDLLAPKPEMAHAPQNITHGHIDTPQTNSFIAPVDHPKIQTHCLGPPTCPIGPRLPENTIIKGSKGPGRTLTMYLSSTSLSSSATGPISPLAPSHSRA